VKCLAARRAVDQLNRLNLDERSPSSGPSPVVSVSMTISRMAHPTVSSSEPHPAGLRYLVNAYVSYVTQR
jgi:hypothetical protein